MHRNYFFVLFLLFNIVCDLINAENCNKTKSTMLRLREDVLCNYVSNLRPNRIEKSVTNVNLHMLVISTKYIQSTQIFSMHALMMLKWKDKNLIWKPEQYDNIVEMKIPVSQIWTPDITMYNEYYIDGNKSFSDNRTLCKLQNNGNLSWTYRVKYSVYCIGDITWWPYDTLNCTLQLHSWSHSNNEIEFTLNNEIITPLKNHPEWDLLKDYVTKRVEKHKYNSDFNTNIFSCHFIMRRNWGIIRIAYVTPTIVLTLISLWLEPRSTERMIIVNLNFICHLLCMIRLHELIPHNGINIPKLLIFYESSLAIAAFILIFTSILRHLQEFRSEPPEWMSSVIMSILHSKVGRILLVSVLDPVTIAKMEIDVDNNMDLVQVDNKKLLWMYVTVLIGWLALLIISLTYIILLSINFPVYMPVNV